MYEQAVRLGQEPPVLSFLLRQARCYLAAMNALQLVDNDYRWIVRPFFKRNCEDKDFCWTNKKILDSNEILRYKIVNHLEILEVNDIKKEYLLCEAQLKIVQLNSDICTSAQPNPSEIITVLSRVGLFSNALDICESFDLDKTFVLETLAAECARSYRYNNLKSWDWLYLNDISDLSLLTTSPPNLAWNLLQSLMEKYEKKDKSSLYKGVARRLYQMGSFIPSWLFQSYAKALDLIIVISYRVRIEVRYANYKTQRTTSSSGGRGCMLNQPRQISLRESSLLFEERACKQCQVGSHKNERLSPIGPLAVRCLVLV
ncbi:nuclear pore complex protein Nup160-like [Copidosoma floridanum]|uniref:nuclear pore complex protein Nup160-like n=1 Tax=Copidosoma floridanum TaxID=29053 RepID=UPI000C6FB66F|nr:nuclear pore complex protein Nup160-like [Copidosoma floridanum]